MHRFISAEWLRLRRFWLTWILLALLLIILTVQIKGNLGKLETLKGEVETGISAADGSPLTSPQIDGDLYLIRILTAELKYPAFIGTAARISTEIGWFLVILFTVVFGGEDFSRRTIPLILTRGVSRRNYLLGRIIALWFAMGAALVAIVSLAAVCGPFIHRQVTVDPISLAGLGHALLWVMRSWVTYLPFIVVVLFWVVLARNMGPALGVGIGTHTLEYLYGFALPVFATVFANVDSRGGSVPWFYSVQIEVFSVTLGYNADLFMNWGIPFARDAMFITGTLGLRGDTLLPTTPWRGLIFMLGYAVVFLAGTLWIFQRRDVKCGG
jgi:ABC-type transport system involved in multi-copper enzyme maturation permease subunit